MAGAVERTTYNYYDSKEYDATQISQLMSGSGLGLHYNTGVSLVS